MPGGNCRAGGAPSDPTPRRAARPRSVARADARRSPPPRRACPEARGCRQARTCRGGTRLRPAAARRQSSCFLVVRVAVDETVAHELTLDRGDGADHAWVVGGEETDERDHQQTRVQSLRAVELGEGIELDVETLLADLPMDLGADRAPPFDGPLLSEALDSLDAAVESDPSHHLRVREVPPRAAYFPDAFVGLLPGVLEKPSSRRCSAHASFDVSSLLTRP